ncbi:lipase [Coprinopsis marcescibilis]|uniref:Lipase n=1 Tax=Coprinopsis marcescibilis TaxID=230819 RepID=A0A5C3KGK7_COPMA|nr:lipase [Coprinopsis marcescibilis]
MRNILLSLFCALATQSWLALAIPVLETRQSNGIDQTTYNNLERFAKFSSASYQLLGCPRPVGTTLIKNFDRSGTQGYLSRDDSTKEIILAFRGSLSVTDAFVDLQLILQPLNTPGVTNNVKASVHTGFQFAYNAVASDVVSAVKSQVSANSAYTVVVTGHSLGGAVASMAALSLKAAIPNIKMKLYTYGQPRVGNAAFVSLVEQQVGVNNIFRAVNTFDGVPTILFKELGYRHFATEYWQFKNGESRSNVRKCTGGDDPSCSDSIPSTFINPAHLFYFGQAMALNPLLCF